MNAKQSKTDEYRNEREKMKDVKMIRTRMRERTRTEEKRRN